MRWPVRMWWPALLAKHNNEPCTIVGFDEGTHQYKVMVEGFPHGMLVRGDEIEVDPSTLYPE